FDCGNAEQLDFPDGSVDLVVLYTVFSSILDETMARNVADEARRVLRAPDPASGRPRGAALWYDVRYANPSNPHTRAMTRQRSPALFPGFRLHLRSITLLPPVARRLGPLTPALYPLLASAPPLRSHYLGLLFKAR